MKPSRLKKMSVFLLLLTTVLSYILIKDAPAFTEKNKITIFHTNDMHGALDSRYTPEGKLIQIGVDVLKALKDSTPNSILVDAGDATQGEMLAASSQGSKIIELMNAAGYDIMALGNHEFDYGVDSLKLNAALAKFKMISANVYDGENPVLFSDTNNGSNVIIEKNGKKIGFFGLTTCEAKFSTHPTNVENLIFKDEAQIARQQYQILKQQNCDIIICIAHIGSTGIDAVAAEAPQIDLIIDGHSHEVYSRTVGHTIIQQIGTKSKNVGKIEVEFMPSGEFNINTGIIKSVELINPLEQTNHQIIPDAKVSALCRDMLQSLSESFKIIVGKTDSGLYGGEYRKTRICRLHDTNLGLLIADALVHHCKKFLVESGIKSELHVVSLQNGGGVRTTVAPKFISVGDILNIFPFPNRAAIKLLNPNQLYDLLENGFKSIRLQNGVLTGTDGAFPHVGGMRIEFDINEEPMKFNADRTAIISQGQRIKKIFLIDENGSDIMQLNRDDHDTQIALVTNNFEASGGDQYIMLKDLPSLSSDGELLKQILCDYIKFITFKNNGSFSYPVTLSRTKLVNCENLFGQYDVTLKIKENSKKLMNESVNIKIDDQGDIYTEKTDENGTLIIKNLQPGPHEIKVSRENHHMNAYVNNTIGVDSADIFLENTAKQEIDNVINLINGISQQKISDMNDYVSFARSAYESLPQEYRGSVSNYEYLLSAEKANIDLNSQNTDITKIYAQSVINPFYTTAIVLILLFALYLIIHRSKTSVRNKE